jgi:transcriptional regulator with XRE-family HTH domain
MISAAQCRSARALLGWSVAKLASAASVSASAIDDFEAERRAPLPAVAGPIRRAFEPVGVAFLPGEDVRLRQGRCFEVGSTPAFAGDSPAEAAPPDRWYHADATPLSNKRRRSSAQRRSVLSASRLLALLAT